MTESNVPPPTPPDPSLPPVPPPTAPAGYPPPSPPVGYADPTTPTGYPGSYIGPAPDQNAKTWGMATHLSALVQLLTIPSFVGPLVVWLMKKNEHPFIDDQGKESLNFQITVMIAALVISPTICLFGLGVLLLIVLGIAALVLAIIAGVKANEGVAYRYPLTLRLIK